MGTRVLRDDEYPGLITASGYSRPAGIGLDDAPLPTGPAIATVQRAGMNTGSLPDPGTPQAGAVGRPAGDVQVIIGTGEGRVGDVAAPQAPSVTTRRQSVSAVQPGAQAAQVLPMGGDGAVAPPTPVLWGENGRLVDQEQRQLNRGQGRLELAQTATGGAGGFNKWARLTPEETAAYRLAARGGINPGERAKAIGSLDEVRGFVEQQPDKERYDIRLDQRRGKYVADRMTEEEWTRTVGAKADQETALIKRETAQFELDAKREDRPHERTAKAFEADAKREAEARAADKHELDRKTAEQSLAQGATKEKRDAEKAAMDSLTARTKLDAEFEERERKAEAHGWSREKAARAGEKATLAAEDTYMSVLRERENKLPAFLRGKYKGRDETVAKELDILWARTGKDIRDAPHRAGEGDQGTKGPRDQGTAERGQERVVVVFPDGVRRLMTRDELEANRATMPRGTRVGLVRE